MNSGIMVNPGVLLAVEVSSAVEVSTLECANFETNKSFELNTNSEEVLVVGRSPTVFPVM